MGKGKEITIGALLSYAQIGIGAIITLLYTPFMIRALGQSEYGLYNTVSSVVSSLSILSLGFGSCYVRFFSKYNAENKEEKINILNGMFMTIFLIIGFIAFLCGVFLSNNLELVFDTGLSHNELGKAKVLMMLLTVNLAISFPASVFTSIITANERFIFQKCILLLKQVVSPLICIPLLLTGYGSVGIVLCTVGLHLGLDICNAVFCFSKLKTRFAFGRFDGVVFKEMAVYSSFIAINMIVDQINLNIDKFLLGRYRGTIAVAVYSAGFTIYQYYTAFSTSISNVFAPRIHHIWNNPSTTVEDKDNQLSKIFTYVGRIQFLILFLLCSGLVLFGKQFIAIWAGSGYENSYYVLLLLAISAITPLSQNVGVEIQRAKNKHQFRSVLYAIMAGINLILSINLCQKYGEIGSALGTAISFIVANSICMNIFYYKILHIKIINYWRNVFRIVMSSFPALIIMGVFCRIVDTRHIVFLLLGISLYSVMYMLCEYRFSLTRQERSDIVSSIKRRMKRTL